MDSSSFNRYSRLLVSLSVGMLYYRRYFEPKTHAQHDRYAMLPADSDLILCDRWCVPILVAESGLLA